MSELSLDPRGVEAPRARIFARGRGFGVQRDARLRGMDPRNLREFARRPRAEVEVEKLVHWAQVFREGGPAATLAAGHALYEHAKSVRPDFPTDRDTALDLEHLLVLKDRIDRASRALFEQALRRAEAAR